MKLTFESIRDAVGDDGVEAGISIVAALEPLGGAGAPVKPAVYAGGTYQIDKRWTEGSDQPVEAVVIDNVPSEANRMEAALLSQQATLGLPMLELDLSGLGDLPAHVPTVLTSFDLPHRHADAYLRDSLIAETGEAFTKSELGISLLRASATNPAPLLEWMPQSLIFGFWQSHLGKQGAQTKLARAVDAEIVGLQPASVETRRLGLKGDPLNLSIDDTIKYDPEDQTNWEPTSGKGGKKLSEIGHGQVPVSGADAPLGAVSFRSIEQRVTVSFPRLRTIVFGDAERNAAGRAVLATLALVAAEAAFAGSFTLRSGCDLRPVSREIIWRGSEGDQEVKSLGMDSAVKLFRHAVEVAEKLDLPVGSRWATAPVGLVPNPNLAKVITDTFGLAVS